MRTKTHQAIPVLSAFICVYLRITLFARETRSRQSPWQQRDSENDYEAHAEVPMLGEFAEDRLGLEELLQQGEGEGAEHRAVQAADAAQDDHHQHRAGDMPAEELRIHEAVLHREE